MNGEQYAQEHGVEFDWSSHGYQRDRDGWEHQSFTVTLTVGATTESFSWRQGLGIESEPEVGQVLSALVQDAYYGDESFEDFCDELGYDPDSRSAYATWEKCQEVGRQLDNLFGEIPDVDED